MSRHGFRVCSMHKSHLRLLEYASPDRPKHREEPRRSQIKKSRAQHWSWAVTTWGNRLGRTVSKPPRSMEKGRGGGSLPTSEAKTRHRCKSQIAGNCHRCDGRPEDGAITTAGDQRDGINKETVTSGRRIATPLRCFLCPYISPSHPTRLLGRPCRTRAGRQGDQRTKAGEDGDSAGRGQGGHERAPLNRQIEGQAMSGNYPSSAPDWSKVCRGEDEDPSAAPLIG